MVPWLIRTIGNNGAPPPPPPFVQPPDVAGGGGWVDLKASYERVEQAQEATRKERRAAEHQLRQSLEQEYRKATGLEPEVIEAFTETLSPVNFRAKEIDWGPALKRLDLLTLLIDKLETIAVLDEQTRVDLIRDEQDIELLLLTIP